MPKPTATATDVPESLGSAAGHRFPPTERTNSCQAIVLMTDIQRERSFVGRIGNRPGECGSVRVYASRPQSLHCYVRQRTVEEAS